MAKQSHIEQLIQKMCPNGVEYKTLGELLDYEQPGKYIVKSAEYDDKYPTPVLTAGQSFILGYTDETDGIYKASKKNPTLIFDDFTTSYHWVDFDFKVKSSAMKMLRPRKGVDLIFRYVYYAMLSIDYTPEEHTRQWISRYAPFTIPVPPLAIQQEIVRIIDAFSNLVDNIDTEIKARERQAELFKEEQLGIIKQECEEWLKLGDICYQPKERIDASKLTADNYVGVDNMLQNKRGVTQSRYVPNSSAIKYIEGDVLIGNIRPNLRKIWLADKVGGTNGDVVTLRRYDKYKAKVLPRFLYYLLSEETFFIYNIQYARGAKMPRGNKEMIMEYSIPLPSLKDQQAIAAKLDTIEAFIANLQEERALRQQQYEYYRAKLISLLK